MLNERLFSGSEVSATEVRMYTTGDSYNHSSNIRILNKLYTLLVKRREGFCCKNTEKHFTVSLNILLEQQCAHYLAGGLS